MRRFSKLLGKHWRKREKEVKGRSLKEVIKRLVDMGLIEAEEGIKATYIGGGPDVLAGFKDCVPTLYMLRKDPDYLRYLEIMENFLRSR